jgi:heat shock protein 5
VFKNGRVEIIANDQGNRITPSYVAFTAEGERLIGDAAKNQLTTNPENTVFDAKRLIGREWTDASVQHDIKYFPFKVIDKNSKPHIKVDTTQGEKIFAAEEISAMVLNKMKETAEAYLGKKVTHAVVTVPAVSIYKALNNASIKCFVSETSLFNFKLSCFSIEYSR